MWDIELAIRKVVSELSDDNYERSLAFCRFWIRVEHTYSRTTPGLTFDAIWGYKARFSSTTVFTDKMALLLLRFINDIESDRVVGPLSVGLQNRFCARLLEEFFGDNLFLTLGQSCFPTAARLYMNSTLIAHCANLGYIHGAATPNDILQLFSQHSGSRKLLQSQAIAICILFKVAGATFDAYCDPSLVDSCFKLLEDHQWSTPSDGKRRVEVSEFKEDLVSGAKTNILGGT